MNTAENYLKIKNEMVSILKECGRKEDDCVLIAVSKTKPISDMIPVYEAGCRDFGENKVQEIIKKRPEMPEDVRWHMIGHLQTNKVKDVVGVAYMIHSVDSLHLAQAISKEAVKKNVTAKILLEVNVGEEESKFGVTFEQCRDFCEEVQKLPGLEVCGLMAIAPYVENPEDNRQYFVNLRQLSVDLFGKKIHNDSSVELSMGMSGDYTVALTEGATMIRVGTSIFGERNYSV